MSELIKEVREEYGCPHGCGWSDGEDEHDLGCNLIVNASVLRHCDDHERLEAMLRAWHAARGDDESEAAIELWREACRLVEEKT